MSDSPNSQPRHVHSEDSSPPPSVPKSHKETDEMPVLNVTLDPKEVKILHILVMGLTGAGKSTFIKYLTQDMSIQTGNGLRGVTEEVAEYIHYCKIGNNDYEIHLIDTPGFNDVKTNDAVVLNKIAQWINAVYMLKETIAGVIYIHDITITRMGATGERSLRMLEKMVGEKNFENITLVTNKWGCSTDNAGEESREKELGRELGFWRRMIEGVGDTRRANTKRFLATLESAMEIVKLHLNRSFSPELCIQMDPERANCILGKTDAGRVVWDDRETERARRKYYRAAFDEGLFKKYVAERNKLIREQQLQRTSRWAIRTAIVGGWLTPHVLMYGAGAASLTLPPEFEAHADHREVQTKRRLAELENEFKEAYLFKDMEGKRPLNRKVKDVNTLAQERETSTTSSSVMLGRGPPRDRTGIRDNSQTPRNSRTSVATPLIRPAPGLAGISFEKAMKTKDFSVVESLLTASFDAVAVGEFSWLLELRQLGYSVDEIIYVLKEQADQSPWIPIWVTNIPQPAWKGSPFHQLNCAHTSRPSAQTVKESGFLSFIQKPDRNTTIGKDSDGKEVVLNAAQTIEYLCGLAGASPARTSDRDSVVFENSSTKKSISFRHRPWKIFLGARRIRRQLRSALRILQDEGGCCDSFTVLSWIVSPSGTPYVEMQRIDTRKMLHFLDLLQEAESELSQDSSSDYDATDLNASSSETLGSIVQLLPELLVLPAWQKWKAPHSCLDIATYSAITVQFLSLALLSYTKGHCGKLRPFFLDTAQEEIVLLGLHDTLIEYQFEQPRVETKLLGLSCMGQMTGQPVMVFNGLLGQERWEPDASCRYHLSACPEDILDTWGPGKLLSDEDNSRVSAICVGGGYIIGTKTQNDTYHWTRGRLPIEQSMVSFGRLEKIMVGARVVENVACKAVTKNQLTAAVAFLQELGTFPSYWQVSERQGGIQAGQYAMLQFNQTWVNMAGMTKKAKMLSQQALHISDLDGPFGVQVSICTGIAKRTLLREVMVDILPTYVDSLITKPPLWKSFMEDHKILEALSSPDLVTWVHQLDHAHQQAFEELVLAILFILQDTGIDTQGHNFVIACIQPGIPFQCFKVPCKQETYWSRILADSDENATFAYMTSRCLETSEVKCRGPSNSWANSSGLLSTAVSCYQARTERATPLAGSVRATPQWNMVHAEGYLIGPPESALFVRVDRPNENDEPRLLVSTSTIPRDLLYRLLMKGRKPRMLRERKALDQHAENVVVLVDSPNR